MAFSNTFSTVLIVALAFASGIESRAVPPPDDVHVHVYKVPLSSSETTVTRVVNGVPVTSTETVITDSSANRANGGRQGSGSLPNLSNGCHGIIKGVANGAGDVLTGAVNVLGGAINDITDSGTVLGPVGGAVDTVGKGAQGILDDAVGGVNNAVDDAACGVKDIVGDALSGIETGNVVGGVEHAADNLVQGVGDVGEDVVGAVGKALDSTAGDLVNFVDHL
uniref:Uncharacterized protein n=1 Tax=Latrodectus hesperus TaxID=256737 RepID=E7D1T5_LATHE|nr:hypothetical protein [Latrodectus hesperus]